MGWVGYLSRMGGRSGAYMMSDKEYWIISTSSTVSHTSVHSSFWNRTRVRRRSVVRWHCTRRQRNTDSVCTKNFRKIGFAVTSVYRVTKRLKLQPNRLQAVQWLQRRCTCMNSTLAFGSSFGASWGSWVEQFVFVRRSIFSIHWSKNKAKQPIMLC